MAKKRKTGRPPKKIDDRQVFKLAQYGCTTPEIAAVMDCSPDTLERRFAATMKRGKDSLRHSLRKAQVESAMGGNVTMLIWLGKQLLGQKNEPLEQAQQEAAPPSMIEMVAMMDASIPRAPSNGNERLSRGETQ